MNAQPIENYQMEGESQSAAEANERINAAKRATPAAERSQFRSYIRYIRYNGGAYVFGWILK